LGWYKEAAVAGRPALARLDSAASRSPRCAAGGSGGGEGGGLA